MSFELLVGPPGSGKTHQLLDRAVELASRGKRVWWAGLPNQRADIYRRATRQGAVLGLEFQTLQQVYYRLLAHARALKPLIVGTGRLALVGEALALEREVLPSPGEARLFAGAIAEAKRFGLTYDDLPGGDPEIDRFRAAYAGYERLKGEAWDYDDFRREALRLAESGNAVPEADALFVDGFRELSPLDLRLLTALGDRCEVRLALPSAPAGHEPASVLDRTGAATVCTYEAANPVSEARWVLNSLKRDLACGFDPLELAVILPQGEGVAFTALADEYRVPVMDERPTALTDGKVGRLLLELLELPDYPTASRLLPIRELAPLTSAALESGVAGHEALARLADRLGLANVWRRWLDRLTLPDEEAPEAIDGWAAGLVDLALSLAGPQPSARSESAIASELFRSQALLRAKEASRFATGTGFRAWWAALLAEANVSTSRRGGVALLDERQASGRSFRKAYLMHATEGSYGTGEREDYFVPEEERAPLASLFAGALRTLPRRFEGRDDLLYAELRAVADELVVTYPAADQGGPLLPETRLTGRGVPGLPGSTEEPRPLPPLPSGSRLELTAGENYRAVLGRGDLMDDVALSLEQLRSYQECAMRFWLRRLLDKDQRRKASAQAGWWRNLQNELAERSALEPQRLDSLGERYPQATEWLAQHRELLLGLSFGVRLPFETSLPQLEGDSSSRAEAAEVKTAVAAEARLDAAVTRGSEACIYCFCPPNSAFDAESAKEYLESRWTELWAAGHMLRRYRGRIDKVRLLVWPVLGEPMEAYPGGIRSQWRRIEYRTGLAHAAMARLSAGDISPSPGFQCGSCTVRDVCREGAS